MKILVTGGAGFIGSNFVRYMLAECPDLEIVNLDALTYAGNLENLAGLEDDARYTFVKGDIASAEDVGAVFGDHKFDDVVNFAAESHVDRSLHVGVAEFIRTNIQGVQNLLDASRGHGVGRFLQVSTDEVYGSLGESGKFTEESPIKPNNPYAASKAAADFFVRAAHKSHGLDVAITRCSNNFGPYQFPEKLIPLVVANALEDKDLPVYGDGMQVRDWIYVLDHCSAIDTVLRKAEPGGIYNIGGDQEVANIETVKTILGILGKPETLIKHVQDRPGHDRRYAMDAGKLRGELGWTPQHEFGEAMRETVNWYLANGDWLGRVRSGEYQSYYDKMYGDRKEVQ
ncbi:dTDP-glucose 4,6-dehydratase [Verrucomicrobiota bacterium]